MEALPQVLVFGVLRAGLYALTSIGLAISLGVIGVVNFAHGDFVMLGAYLAFWLYLFLSGAFGGDVSALVIVTGLPLVGLALFAFGGGVFRLTIRPVMRQPELNQMLLTFGISILIQNLALILIGGQARDANLGWRFDLLDLGPFGVTYARLAVFAVSIVLVASVYLILQRTRVGKQMRAVAQNRLGAQIVGISVDRVYLLAFGMSTALAGAAGVMLIFQTQVSPFLGLGFILKAFAVVVLAGLGNLWAIVLASVLLGVAEQAVSRYVPNGASLADGLFFVLIFVTLIGRSATLRRA